MKHEELLACVNFWKKKREGKCSGKYCSKCIEKQYMENYEELKNQEYWICYTCLDKCFCSICKKKSEKKDEDPNELSNQDNQIYNDPSNQQNQNNYFPNLDSHESSHFVKNLRIHPIENQNEVKEETKNVDDGKERMGEFEYFDENKDAVIVYYDESLNNKDYMYL